MKKISLLITISILLISCSKDSDKNNSILTVNPSFRNVLTKALIDDSNINTMDIRIHVSKSDGSEYSAGNSKLLLQYSTSWSLSSTLFLSSNPATIFAYSPVPADPGTVETGEYNTLKRLLDINYPIAQDSQVDYLWAKQNKTSYGGELDIVSSSPLVNLRLHHALSLISFVIYKDNYPGVGLFDQFSIKDNSLDPSFIVRKETENDLYLSVNDGVISGGEKVNLVSINAINDTITLLEDPGIDPLTLKNYINGYALLAPVSISDRTKVNFTFKIDNKDYSVDLPGPGTISWSAGNQYIYKVHLTGTQVVIQDVTVTPWNPTYEDEIIIIQ